MRTMLATPLGAATEWKSSSSTSLPARSLHATTAPSAPPVMASDSSSENGAARMVRTLEWCTDRDDSCRPVPLSHDLSVKSALAEKTARPEWDRHRQVTSAAWAPPIFLCSLNVSVS